MKILVSIFVFLFALSAFGKINLDTEKSQLSWKGTKLFQNDSHAGTIKIKEGFVTMKGETLTGGKVVIDMTSIATTDKMSEKMKKKLDGHLKDEDFFAVGKHPTAMFEIKKVTKKGNKHLFSGELTIRGKTQPAEVEMTVTKDGKMMKAKGTLTFDRSKFDVKYNSKSVFPNLVKTAKDKVIDDKIKVQMALIAPMTKKK